MPGAPPTPALVQTLPYVAWILIAALAFGSFAFVVVTRHFSDAATGYVRFSAVTAAVLGVLTALAVPISSASAGLIIRPLDAAAAQVVGVGCLLFVVLSSAYVLLVGREKAAVVAGAAGVVASAVTLAGAAFGWAPTSADAVPLLVQLAMLSVVTGGSLAAIVLGHWYLVTPKISERPLILQSRMLLAAIALQLLLFITWTTLAGGPGQQPFSVFTTGPVLLIVLRLLVTLLFPLVLVYMAWRTARSRSMESATGLLYINLAAVMAGTIAAGALYVSSGILA